MGESFHHVLTELALLDFRNTNRYRKPHRIIPVLLNGDPKICFPKSIPHTVVRVDHKNPYKSLFKILLMFQGLEGDRLLIEAFSGCFDRCEDLLRNRKGSKLERYQVCFTITLGTLRGLTDRERLKVAERRTFEALENFLKDKFCQLGQRYDSLSSSLTNDY